MNYLVIIINAIVNVIWLLSFLNFKIIEVE